MIDVEDLAFDAPHGRVLDKVSFIVRAGAVLGLVGPAGAGKSILLRCLASLEAPGRGRISMAGVDPQRDPASLRRVLGYVADRYGLYDALTVRQALTYAARAHGVSEAEAPAAVARIADEVDLAQTLGMLVATLTPARRERLALAQALVHAPRVLLLDTVAGWTGSEGGPPPPWTWAMPVIACLAAQGLTAVICAASSRDLPPGCTDLLQLERGRVDGHGVTRLTAAPAAQAKTNGPPPFAPAS